MCGSYSARLIVFCLALSAAAAAQQPIGGRRDLPIDISAPPPPIAPYEDHDIRRARAYPEQPPTIPHAIEGYEISVRGNKCLSCHSRRRAAATGAPMAGVSHFRGRDMQIRSEISPARYFCTQCHVPQTTAPPPVANDFIDGADLPAE